MHISYKPLWHTLLERDMRKEDLRLVPGWKEIDQRFRSTLKADGEEETEAMNTLPELVEGQTFSVTADILEHFTSPPKAYTEDICCERGIRNHP